MKQEHFMLSAEFRAIHHNKPGTILQTKGAKLAGILPYLTGKPFSGLCIIGQSSGLIEFLIADRTLFHLSSPFQGHCPFILMLQYFIAVRHHHIPR